MHKYIMEYYFTIENNGVLPFAAVWIHLEYMLFKSDRERHVLYNIIICGIKKNHK